MKFPLIQDVATIDLVKIDIDSFVDDALDLMYKHNHRDVIVIDKNVDFYIITAPEILKLKLNNSSENKKLSDLNLAKIPIIQKDENILDTIKFIENNIEYIAVVDQELKLFGLLTHTDIVSHIDPETLMENYRLSDLMKMNKDIQKISKDTITNEVLEKIISNNYDCVVIIENKIPIGVLTTKDVVKLLKNKPDLTLPVSQYMSTPIITLDETSSIKEAVSFMKEQHFKRIVIVNGKKEFTGLILQKELISLSYSRWAMLMKQYSTELSEINYLLEQKNKKFEKMASSDQLTGLYNRYKFTELFISEYNTMTKRGNEMSLIILDIDYFKNINDKYGHNIGDKVLLKLSNILLRYLRNVDIIARWGGEEFVVLLPTASLENTLHLTEKIRVAIEKFDMENGIKITASFGITEVIEGDDIKSAIKRADDALYEAKNSGRNCIKYKILES